MRTCAYIECDERFEPNRADHRYHHHVCRNRQNRLERKHPDDRVNETLRPVEAGQGGDDVKRKKRAPKPPRGWEAKAEFDAERGRGRATTTPLVEGGDDPDEEELLRSANLDPTKYRIVGKRKYSTWQQGGQWRTSHKFDYEPRTRGVDEVAQADVAELIRDLEGWEPDPYDPPPGDDAFVVCLSDWQIGKGEGGGTPLTLRVLRQTIADVEARIEELRAIGRPLDTLHVFLLGDLVEGCGSCWYPMGSFQQDLSRREQVKLVRRMLRDAVKRWARMFRRVVVSVIPGNHGENRDSQHGRAFTDFGDNDDVAVAEQVAEALAENPAFDHVEWRIPEDELSLSVSVAGVPVGLVHGHQFGSPGKKPAGPQRAAAEWWTGQEFGLKPVKDCMVLVSGHFHHYSQIHHGPRTHIQAPTIDGGSKWFSDTKGLGGKDDPTGTLTFRVHPDLPGCIGDVQIVSARRRAPGLSCMETYPEVTNLDSRRTA